MSIAATATITVAAPILATNASTANHTLSLEAGTRLSINATVELQGKLWLTSAADDVDFRANVTAARGLAAYAARSVVVQRNVTLRSNAGGDITLEANGTGSGEESLRFYPNVQIRAVSAVVQTVVMLRKLNAAGTSTLSCVALVVQ